MSSSPLALLMALTSFLMFPGGSAQDIRGNSAADLLLRDEIEQAEALLDQQPRTAESTALRGEVEYRKGNFDKADALYREALNMDANTARAHFGVGKLAIARLKGREAIAAIGRAIELEPDTPLYRLYASEAYAVTKNQAEQRRQLEEYVRLSPVYDPDRLAEAKSGVEMLHAFSGREIARLNAPEHPAPIPLRKALNLIFADVMLNGQGPYDFAIDTGATQTVLSERLAADLGLDPVTATFMHGIGGTGKIESQIYRIDELAIGGVKISDVPAGTFSDPLLTQIADGILPTAVFSDFILTIDYSQSQMEFAHRTATPSPSTDILPAWYFNNLLLVRLELNGQHHGNFIVDTGAVTTVLSHRMAAQLGVTEATPGAAIDLGIAGIGGFEGVVLRVPDVTFRTANHTERFPHVVAIDLSQISRMIGTEVAGILGFDFLEGYSLTLDYEAAEVRLNR